ncbi:MAG TPA: GNAT family N-acyltransferase [Azospirillaceae bacterium]|nr:GNAT family N-acyltransferase [Azospirillaceae bacterium]
MADITTDALYSGDLRMGSLEVRLAETNAEVQAAQALRYRVFYEEMQAKPSAEIAALRRDFDHYDPLCDHLLVIDHNLGSSAAGVVGTYRLIRRPVAARIGSFYSSDEYDISRLEEYPGEILELGRSCVDPAYRSRQAMQLLWRGIAAYVNYHDIRLLFGCASLPGTDYREHALPLSYLYWHHLAPPALRPVALPHRYTEMKMLDEHEIDPRRGLNAVPALIKGYLRLGGFVGEGAVVDHQFNTTDVSIVVKTDMITDKYLRHYERRGTALI